MVDPNIVEFHLIVKTNVNTHDMVQEILWAAATEIAEHPETGNDDLSIEIVDSLGGRETF